MSLFLLLLPVALGIYTFVRIREQLRVVEAQWRFAGEQVGLQCHSSRWSQWPTLRGEVRGFPVTVTTRRRLGVRRRWAWELESREQVDTVIEVGLPFALPGRLMLRPQGFIDSLSIAVGGQDVIVGDARFDEQTRVRADDPAAVRSLLAVEPLRRRLLELWQALPRSEIADRRLRVKVRGAEHAGAQLAAYLRQAVDVAEALRAAQRTVRRAG